MPDDRVGDQLVAALVLHEVREGLDVADPVWVRDERGTSYAQP